MFNINDLTLGQIKEIQALNVFAPTLSSAVIASPEISDGLNCMIGKKVIIRTYSAGVWFGELQQKSGKEIILINARRMWQWKAAKSISLSSVATFGLDHSGSKVVKAVESVWLEAIEIMPCSADSVSSIEGAPDVKAN